MYFSKRTLLGPFSEIKLISAIIALKIKFSKWLGGALIVVHYSSLIAINLFFPTICRNYIFPKMCENAYNFEQHDLNWKCRTNDLPKYDFNHLSFYYTIAQNSPNVCWARKVINL